MENLKSKHTMKGWVIGLALILVLGLTPSQTVGNYQYVTQWGGFGSGDSQFYYTADIAIDSSGNVYVTDIYNHRVQKFDQNGNFLGWLGKDDQGGTGWHGPGSGRVGVSGSGDGEFREPKGIYIH